LILPAQREDFPPGPTWRQFVSIPPVEGPACGLRFHWLIFHLPVIHRAVCHLAVNGKADTLHARRSFKADPLSAVPQIPFCISLKCRRKHAVIFHVRHFFSALVFREMVGWQWVLHYNLHSGCTRSHMHQTYAQYTPLTPTRLNSTVASRRRRQCVLGFTPQDPIMSWRSHCILHSSDVINVCFSTAFACHVRVTRCASSSPQLNHARPCDRCIHCTA